MSFGVFDAWETLEKARKAKGLSQWERLKPLAEKLEGKGIQAISFTCSHPSHTEPSKHVLGSVEGNLHFLLGYANPEFHFAPYHLSIIDPATTLEEAEEAFKKMSHPSNPTFWAKAAFTAGPEGDIEEGQASPRAGKRKEDEAKTKERPEESVEAKSPTGSYTCSPSEGLVYGNHNDHVYRWDMVKDSFFSYFNPEATEVMNNAAIIKSQSALVFRTVVPEEVTKTAAGYKGSPFHDDVWPLVKSQPRKPGNIIPLEATSGEIIYGVMTDSALEFYSKAGESTSLNIFNTTYKSFDLTKDSTTPPAILLSFLTSHLGVNKSLLDEVIQG
jgi:hypothetical protein